MAPWVNFQPWQQTPAPLGAGSLLLALLFCIYERQTDQPQSLYLPNALWIRILEDARWDTV